MKRRIIRFPKVRVTDYRPPPGAGGQSPLERVSATRGGSVDGMDTMTAAQAREAIEHERFISGYSTETLQAAAMDLRKRRAWDRRNQEHRWVMGRVAAILRHLDRKGVLP